MRRTIWASLFALATALVGTEAKAGGDWGIHSGDTLRASDLMVYGEVGWPDLSVGLQYGLSPKFDIGGRLSLLFGYENIPLGNIGFGAQFVMRFGLVKSQKLSVLLHLNPGIKVYGDNYYGYNYNCGRFGCAGYSGGGAVFGLQIPVGVEFGIHLAPKWTLQLGADLPVDIFFYGYPYGTTAVISPMIGAGFEYHVNERLGLGVNTRLGPSIFTGNNGYYGYCGYGSCGRASLGLLAQFFIGYRI